MRALLLVVLGACSGEDYTYPPGDTAWWLEGTCGVPGETYSQGMRKATAAGTFDVVLADSDPKPPDRGWNTWTMRVVEPGTDTPVTGATVVVTPVMPEHGHGTTPATFTLTDQGGGTYVTPPMHLFMSGVWQLTFAVSAGARADSVAFTFCLEG